VTLRTGVERSQRPADAGLVEAFEQRDALALKPIQLVARIGGRGLPFPTGSRISVDMAQRCRA
jgi:hypothetical protein